MGAAAKRSLSQQQSTPPSLLHQGNTILIRDSAGTLIVATHDGRPVATLKAMISLKRGYQPEHFYLTVAGKVMEDEAALYQYDLTQGSGIQVLHRGLGGMPHPGPPLPPRCVNS